MAEPRKTESSFVWVTDKAGNQFICPINALKDPKNASKEELANCVDEAKAGVAVGD